MSRPWMNRDCGHASIGMPELLVRTTLANLSETQPLEPCHHFTGLEDWWWRHNSRHDGLDTDEFGFEVRFAVLKQERNHFLHVAVELIERFGLAVGTGKSRDVSDVQTSVGIAFDDCGIGLHGRER